MTPKAIINSGLNYLGKKYRSDAARRLMLAIGYQESAFARRIQVKGPARGFWQFETFGGILGVLTHATTKEKAAKLVEKFGIGKVTSANKKVIAARLHNAFEREKNDPLAAAFARLLLWTDPRALPSTKEEAWEYYLRNWRPGKPHPDRWDESWEYALEQMGELEPKEA